MSEVYSQFLQAVRERLIDDIAEASKSTSDARPVKRFKRGFLLGPPSSPSEWGSGWEHYAQCRPLIHCHLHLHLSPSRLIIKPLLTPTPFHPLPFYLPSPPGTPITLLPYGTPAYLLSSYTGPTSVLTSQFTDSLAGLGTGDWASPPPYTSTNSAPGKGPMYVIAWVGVQNKQGEDKGLPLIWPARLCVAFHPAAQCARKPLAYLPALPPELQASPVPPPPPDAPAVQVQAQGNKPIRPSLKRSSVFTARAGETQAAFKCMTLVAGGKDMPAVAAEASAYVEAVARERERERERLKRERESAHASSPMRSAPPMTPTPMTLSTPAAVGQTPVAAEETPIFPPSSSPAGESPMVVEQELGMVVPLPSASLVPEMTPMDMDVTLAPSTSPAVQPADTLPAPSASASVSPNPDPDPDPISFDTFTTFEPSWAQPSSADFMGYGFGDGEPAEPFDVFTEDDFNFFDRPSAGDAGLLNISPPAFGEGMRGFAAASPVKTQSSPWPVLGMGMGAGDTPAPPPELDPSSPAGTPSAYSDPPTPTVQLAAPAHASQLLLGVPRVFDPIPFAPAHKASDDKYAMGKFAVGEAQRDGKEMAVWQGKEGGWKFRYSAVTDPRVGVVRQLIGVKRKSIEQGMRDMKLSPPWIQEPEDWFPCTPDEPEEDKSEPESEEEDRWMDDDDESRSVSRPSTPLPPYLPLGPTLLHTQFHHSQLLPASSALRPPDAPAALAPAAAPPMSVPTPVSPAAALSAASEKSKSLEAAALMFAKEQIENPVWAQACRVKRMDEERASGPATEVWQSDAHQALRLLAKLEGCPPSMEVRELLASDAGSDTTGSESAVLRRLKPPLMTVTKSDAVIQTGYTALRFWEKLGLSPRNGKKDVSAFVFFEDEGDSKVQQVESWLTKVSSRYKARNLGCHVAGKAAECTRDGIVPLKLESIRKTLVNFVASLAVDTSNIVFYVVTPASIMALSSPVLRQIFSATKRTLKSHTEKQILFHLVPEHLVFASAYATSRDSPTDILVHSVYDRILRPVDRYTARPQVEQLEPRRAYVQEPAFVAARALHNSALFLREGHLRTLDVADRHTLLHVGYRISECGKWLLATCVDQRGEGYDVGVWLYPEDRKEEQVVDRVWGFACQMARRASVDWRVVVTKLGFMAEDELQVWISRLRVAVADSLDVSLHASVMVAEQGNSWTFLAPERKQSKPISPQRHASKDTHGTTFLDASWTAYTLNPPGIYTFPLTPPTLDYSYDVSCVPELTGDSADTDIGALPALSSTLVYVPAGTDHTSISMLNYLTRTRYAM
ncbi:hypothetical protein GLOTRDRAFT_119718 [Gloeophyllum trabeum ATCC 11539]|uniref:Mediator of RNA polymerase II transcription subunit 13 n=1 Tax=Gloeophyllum trabeum (strain ATCC 11539 / FP-39264 / Madison 617) TaxID=670483 RepID=S7RXS8_GLOTA|nr:uncharacterized protein GLOTRDRAFT_119718 [Gloeophyllum trabeum ATCC 11539]EPQ59740.1 hypothetical protein GLOTRDRAFT_119718 [Gloeophyllum trabeum ATCC 11539]